MGKLHCIKAELFEIYDRPASRMGFGIGEFTHYYLYSDEHSTAVDITAIVMPDARYNIESLQGEYTKKIDDLVNERIKLPPKNESRILCEGAVIEFENKPYDDSSYGSVISAMKQVAFADKSWFRKAKKRKQAVDLLKSACISSKIVENSYK